MKVTESSKLYIVVQPLLSHDMGGMSRPIGRERVVGVFSSRKEAVKHCDRGEDAYITETTIDTVVPR